MMGRSVENVWTHFDYESMAEEVRRERDRLYRLYRRLRDEGPKEAESHSEWDQRTRRCYDEYLEQRTMARELERRAAKRRAEERRAYAA